MEPALLQASKAPIYITVGPQCCGKTTIISKLQQQIDPNARPITDIALDDQNGVYINANLRYFISPPRANDPFLRKRMIGKTIGQRIEEQYELRLVLQRLAKRLSANEFASAMRQLYQGYAEQAATRDNDNRGGDGTEMAVLPNDCHAHVAETWIAVIEQEIDSSPASIQLPRNILLFCVEALFRAHPKTKLTAIDVAANELQRFAMNYTSMPLAHGNTNTRPREYKAALQTAADSRRPVYFIVQHSESSIEGIGNGIFIPAAVFSVLLQRNVRRLIRTGKFVPAKGMYESTQRCQNLVDSVMRELSRNSLLPQDDGGDVIVSKHSKLDFDRVLAKMANFEMADDRTVTFRPPPQRQRRQQEW